MLNVLMSVMIGLAVNPEPLDDADLEMSAPAEPDGENSGSEEGAAARRMRCAYGHELQDENLCLARCSGDSGFYDVLGFPIEDDRGNREYCIDEAKTFCSSYGRKLKGWCWGDDFY